MLLPENWEVKAGGSRLPPRAEPAGGGGWPRVPIPCAHGLLPPPAKKGPSEDKDDISKLVTGLMKTSICRQISYKTVEGVHPRDDPSLAMTSINKTRILCSNFHTDLNRFAHVQELKASS